MPFLVLATKALAAVNLTRFKSTKRFMNQPDDEPNSRK